MRVASAEAQAAYVTAPDRTTSGKRPAQERDAGGDTDGQDSGNEAGSAAQPSHPCHQQRGHRAR